MWGTLSKHRCCEYEHTYRYYPLMWMDYTSWESVLLQVVIGGINVDFIAKGKTKTLRVRTSLLKIVGLLHIQYEQTYMFFVPFSLGKPTQEVCSSPVEALVVTSPVRFYTITSHVCFVTPGLNLTACFFFKSPWVDWGTKRFSSPLLEPIPAVMPCFNTVNRWWVCNCAVKSFYSDMQI